jgi:hypothetical protein
MACNLNSGIALGCRDVVGGVQTVWMTDFDNVTSLTQSTGDTITTISGTGTYYKFELIRTSSQFTETVNASLENGTVFYTGELVLYFNKLDQDKRNILKTLAQSPKLSVVMQDNIGQFFYLGQTYGMYVSAGSSVTGKALGDQQGYNITLQYLEPNPMNEIEPSLSAAASGITVQ